MNDLKIKGITYDLVDKVTNKFLIGLRESNPMLLNMFKDRNKKPYLDLNPWSGEFVGKYLTGSYYAYKLTHNEKLKQYIQNIIKELISYQDEDGYLGVYSNDSKMTGANSFEPERLEVTWDSWNHYHIMFGLYKWYKETNGESIFDSVKKVASFYLNRFYKEDNKKLSDLGSTEMNLAVYHIFGILYNETKDTKYLDFALKIEEDMKTRANTENYLEVGLKRIPFYKCKKPRWESLHPMMGYIEMYKATKDEKYLKSIEFLVDSIIETDCHNTGGFSTREQAIGNPYTIGPIETCCVVAFDALLTLLYKNNHNIKYIDLLERAHYNAMLGANHISGSSSTYDTPMEGYKVTNQVFNNFQTRAGSPNLNCCSVNAPRGISEIVDWMIYENDDSVYVNTFEMCDYSSSSTDLKIKGLFPYQNRIKIIISKSTKPIKIRIPSWSLKTTIIVDGVKSKPNSGEYYDISNAKEVVLVLDYKIRYEKGAKDFKKKTCLYYGPILLAYDRGINDKDLIPLSKKDIRHHKATTKNNSLMLKLENGIILSDFYNAGQGGNFYTTWLDIIK